MKLRKLILIVLLLGLCLTGLHAQEAITASGGNASGSGGSVSYSVGQVFYMTATGTDGSVAQGVQQPYEISVISGIEETSGINLFISAFPNPTTDYITLKVDPSASIDFRSLTYLLYDINGKLLQSSQLEGAETIISMLNLSVATYILKVRKVDMEIKTFKIIKNSY